MAQLPNIDLDDHFKTMLLELSHMTNDDALSAYKFLCKDSIPKRFRERIESPLDLWEALEEREKISSTNVQFLKKLLEHGSENRREPIRLVEEYERKYLSNSANGYLGEDRIIIDRHFQGTAPTQADQPDQELLDAFDYLHDNLGRKWRDLARALGVTPVDIQAAEDDYRELKEQGYHMLLRWKKKKKEAATIQELIRGLRKRHFNQLADNVERGNYN